MKATLPPLPVMLVIDDDDLVLDGLEATFEDDFRVLLAGSAERAREIVAEQEIDVVVSDDRLPRESGVEFLAWMATVQPLAIRILLTGFFSEPGDVIRAINQGRIWHYVRKPWEAGSMRNLIERAFESKQRLVALQASERRFRQLFSRVPVGLFEADSSGVLSTWNESFSQILGGWPVGERDLSRHLPPETWQSLLLELDSGGQSRPMEFELRRVDDGFTPVLMRLHAMGQGVVGGTLTDLSQRQHERELESQLRVVKHRLNVGVLAMGAIHDLRNDLSVLAGNLEMLSQDIGEREEVEEMSQALRSAIETSGQVLGLATEREAGQGHCELNPCCLTLSRAVQRLSPDIDVEAKLCERDCVVALGPYPLRQCVLNLLLNAAQAMPQGGRIELSTRVVGGMAELRVRDHGSGIPERHQSEVFEAFFTTKSEGSGLGLAMVRGIAEDAGGYVRFLQPQGKGASFVLGLPLHESSAPEAAHDQPMVLLIDDNPAVRRLVARGLARAGIAVVPAGDGAAALELLDKVEPDLVMLDGVLPGMSGLQVLKKIRAHRPELPVLFCTGMDEAPELLELSQQGLELLRKPFTLEALQAAVKRLIPR